MRQTNLFEYLGDLREAVEQELAKAHELVEPTEDLQTPLPDLKEITETAYRQAITKGNSQDAMHYWSILKDMQS